MIESALVWLVQRPVVARALLLLLAALAVVLVAMAVWLKVITLQRDNIRLQVADLSRVIELQNSKVVQWQEQAARQERYTRQAQAEAARVRAESSRRLENLIAAIVPDHCAGAMAWAGTEAANLARGWAQ